MQAFAALAVGWWKGLCHRYLLHLLRTGGIVLVPLRLVKWRGGVCRRRERRHRSHARARALLLPLLLLLLLLLLHLELPFAGSLFFRGPSKRPARIHTLPTNRMPCCY